MKSSGVTYDQLALKLSLSTATIKRLLNGHIPMSIVRLEEVCRILGIDFYELARISKYGIKAQVTFLTLEQEKTLADNEELFVVFYLVVMGKSFEEIINEYRFTRSQIIKLASKLETLDILELHPKNKLKMKVYRKSRWNFDGPLHKKYMIAMAKEFAQEVYEKQDSFRFFFNCPVSAESRNIVLSKMRDLTREIERLSETDLNIEKKTETSMNIFIGAREWMPPVQRKYLR